jgi:xanthine dehydrogenase accessory factor
MAFSLYTRELLERARSDAHRGLPDGATHVGRARSRFCGDDVRIGLVVQGGKVVDAGWEGAACAVCAASAHTLCGSMGSGGDPKAVAAALEAALAGEAAEGSEFACFSEVAAYPSRLQCVRLPWQALERGLEGVGEPAPASSPPAASGSDPAELAGSVWDAIRGFRASGGPVALATLVSVVGSSPAPLGSHMVIDVSGRFWGSVSGGCVESAVVQTALEVLSGEGPRSRLGVYQISNSQAAEVGLPCGGQVRIHVAPAPAPEAVDAYAAGAPFRVVDLADGDCLPASDEFPGDFAEALAESRRRGGPVTVERSGRTVFVQPLVRPPRIAVVGGTHIAQKLAQLAKTVGYEPVVVDPRPAFAEAHRFPGVRIVRERAENALPGLVDRDTAVVLLTHDASLDDPGLRFALPSPAFYVGALGSRKTQRARLERLAEQGVAASDLARLRGPAGLPIDARGAGEIALSILSEIVAARNREQVQRRVGAVFLAAGSSRRAGPTNKLLQQLDGQPLVARALRAVLDADIEPVVVVLGHEADAVRQALEPVAHGADVRFVHHPSHEDGMGTSIACGIASIAALPVDAALVVLGDMPFVRPEELKLLVRAHTASTQHLVVVPEVVSASGRSRPGNPVLWPRRYFGALSTLEGDVGGKQILRDAPGAIVRIPVSHDGVLRDVDRILAIREV